MPKVPEHAHRDRRRQAVAALARVLRAARRNQRLSQQQAAMAAGIALYTYQSLERGLAPSGADANPTLDTILRAFAVLDIDPLEAFREA